MKHFSLRQLVGLLLLFGAMLVAMGLCLLIDRAPDGTIALAWPDASFATFRYTVLGVGAIVGAALAISGVLLQALLRNPLASPYILGVSSGAGLGVMFAMYLAYTLNRDSLGMTGQTGPAIIGGLVTLAVVYTLGQRRGRLDPVSLVLIGVVVSTICAAGIMLFQQLVPTGLRGEFVTWLMGYLPQSVDGGLLTICSVITLVGLIVAILMGSAMDAATLGDDEARSIGLAIGPLRLAMFTLAGLLAAITVALAGPIGFVGLIAPHGARLILGPRHTALVLGSAFLGVTLVLGAYAGSRLINLGSGQLPIGIFTSLIGGPAFLWLLLSGKGQS